MYRSNKIFSVWQSLLIGLSKKRLFLALKAGFGLPKFTGEFAVSVGLSSLARLYLLGSLQFLPQCGSPQVRGSVHETPLFPRPESAVCLCLFPVVLSVFLSHVIQWSTDSICLSERLHMNVCVPGLVVGGVAGAGSTMVHICALRQCGALWFSALRLLTFFFLFTFIYICSFSNSWPLPSSSCHHRFLIYSIKDVWLNILRLVKSSWFFSFQQSSKPEENQGFH